MSQAKVPNLPYLTVGGMEACDLAVPPLLVVNHLHFRHVERHVCLPHRLSKTFQHHRTQETYILPTPSPRIAHYRNARYPQVPDLPPGRAPIHLHLHIYPRRLPSLARSQQDRVSRGNLYGPAHLALEESLANALEPDANGWQSSWHFLARSSHRRKAQSICELMLCCNGCKFAFSDRSKSTEALTLF